ncbi:putative ABC transporter [Piedraia hortae CBS 480.64]|uniref:Putative ABC transporter n=1 Tax=Piedraia hortae CBS 480.64 TaxID=1314780 RepID=A0A6A7C3A9_9PEZI|nr:putative ABC transporter [Piedraia hortae CBS 480.64]
MSFVRQTWTLCEKTLRIVLFRHWLRTILRALIAPVVFMFFISYAKNFFIPPSNFGVGHPRPLRDLANAIASSTGGRDIFLFVNNGHTGGAIDEVISQVRMPIDNQGMEVKVLNSDDELLRICRGSIRSVSRCFAAVSFISSPNEGPGGLWNYTIRADGAMGSRIYVNRHNNDAEIFVLPVQHAVDAAIASLENIELPEVDQFPFTSQTAAQRKRQITRMYMRTLINILAVAYFIGMVGVCFQLTGEMAKEREMGMSQLIEAMMPNRRRWIPQAARLLAMHLAFDILYLPSWILMGIIIARQNYYNSDVGVLVSFFILAGLSLSSWSIAFASLFRKAQLSGITVAIVSILLTIIIQVVPPQSTGACVALSLIFPPINYTMFIIYMAYWQRHSLGPRLLKPAPDAIWEVSGWVFFVFAIFQFAVYPVVGALVERALYGTASQMRSLRYRQTNEPTVKVSGLSKIYRPKWWRRWKNAPPVCAVNNLDLTVLHGQILVLLGANGSGKSTTLDMLSGLQKPTEGTIEMDATGGIGLCPQKNVLWDELTVYEHVSVFNRLKSDHPDPPAALKKLVAACDLDQKVNAKTKTLSGGQKRKCQLAMMLTGGSSLCMLDEVSSGLDPLSRRKIWDIILAERGRRSMILTTHFLDEADLLSDDITILSQGQRVASGSAVALKHQHGGGYSVRIYRENYKPLPASSNVPQEIHEDQIVYRVPDSASALKFVSTLEAAGIQDYQVNGPTIEDVFLNLATEIQDDLDSGYASINEKGLSLADGTPPSAIAQTWILFRKRATILRRNLAPYIAAVLIPIAAAGLVTLYLRGFDRRTCEPTDQVRRATTFGLTSFSNQQVQFPYGPSVDVKFLKSLYPLMPTSIFHEVKTLQELETYISEAHSHVSMGGFFIGDKPTFAWRGNYNVFFAVAAQNILDISMTDVPIVTNFRPFDITWSSSAQNTLQFIFYFGLALCISPAFFALYVNRERLGNVRALHYSNGIRASSIWMAYVLFDFFMVLFISTICMIILAAATDVWYGPGYLWLVFILFGLSATLMAYLVSLFAPGPLATFSFAAGAECAFFLLYFITYMCITVYCDPSTIDNYVRLATYTLGFVFPAANLIRALFLTFNEFSSLCHDSDLATNYGGWSVYGSCICYLILQSILFMTVLIIRESGWRPQFKRSVLKTPDIEKRDMDPDVCAEAYRVEKESDELRVLHLSKSFGKNVAVDDVTLGVRRGEIYGLLGPNGAGKSTTIGLVRGDMSPNAGDVLIENTSIAHRAVARAKLGVCPQFDAMDSMTTAEHLTFYARARGVPSVKHNVAQILEAVGLTPYRDRFAAKLSGGNKRKLSLGIALIGNPSVVLLDEPSSGMDAASKRVMWHTLRNVASGRALVLTTHSMEEADALASRVGILSTRMLATGTIDSLRRKWNDMFQIHLVHKNAPRTSEADMLRMKAFATTEFSGSVLEKRSFHGQLRFSIPRNSGEKDGEGISHVFGVLESWKDRLGVEYYSVAQSTLDQVFLRIVGDHVGCGEE